MMKLFVYACLLLNLFASVKLLSPASPPEANVEKSNTRTKKVIIVGAGAAGIAAASRLCENGITDVLLLEAEDRVGGRIYSLDVPGAGAGNVVEIGAQWVHGEKGNVVYELASARNLLLTSDPSFDNMFFVHSNAQIADAKLANEMWKLFENVRSKIDDDVLQYRSVGDYYLAKFNSALQRNNISTSKDLELQFVEFFHQATNALDASDTWFESAASGLIDYWECEGRSSIAWKPNGYKQILSILSENADAILGKKLIENLVRKRTEVVKITPEDNHVHIKCDNGEEYTADHVIVTVSLGVLKANYKKLFPENLLSNKTERAIQSLSLGNVAKMYLKFPHKWWPANISDISLLWTPSDRSDYEKQGMKWLTDVYVFMTVDHHDTMLCGWVCGQSARSMEATDENLVKKQLMQLLRKLFGGKYNIPEPDWFYRSTWKSNPHFNGTYSLRSPAADLMNASAIDLSIPVMNKDNVPVILFAGEATNPHHYSTVHGAVETGWREADRIISLGKSAK